MAETIPCVLGCFGNDPDCPGCHGKGVTIDTGADASAAPIAEAQFIAMQWHPEGATLYALDTFGHIWMGRRPLAGLMMPFQWERIPGPPALP